MQESKKLVTYSRRSNGIPAKSREIDGMRRSIAEGERRILQDISNIDRASVAPLVSRPSISLKSPNTSPSQQIALLKINSRDEIFSGSLEPQSPTIHAGQFEEFEIHQDHNTAVPANIPSTAGFSDDIWSPSKIAMQSGAPPLKVAIQPGTLKPFVRKSRLYPPIDFTIDPRDLDGKSWVRTNPDPLQKNSLPDHFEEN
jgi:hypothetical protein